MTIEGPRGQTPRPLGCGDEGSDPLVPQLSFGFVDSYSRFESFGFELGFDLPCGLYSLKMTDADAVDNSGGDERLNENIRVALLEFTFEIVSCDLIRKGAKLHRIRLQLYGWSGRSRSSSRLNRWSGRLNRWSSRLNRWSGRLNRWSSRLNRWSGRLNRRRLDWRSSC